MKVWKIVGLVVLVVVVVWAGLAIFGNGATSVGEGQVVEVERGDLEMTISASGTVVAPRQARLSFESAGTISELSVEVGDGVKKGQVLARLETASLERAVAQAEAGLKTAQAGLEKAQKPYDENDFAQSEAAVAQAEAGLKTAQAGLEKAQEPYDEKDIAQAEAAVAQAEAALKVAQGALEDTWKLYDENAIADAEAAVRNAKVALGNAQMDLASTQEAQATNIVVAENSVAKLERAYIQVVDKYYNIGCTPAACSQVEPELLGGGTVEEEVYDAWIALMKARSDLVVARLAAAKTIAAAQNSVDQAGDTLRNAEQALEDTLKGADASDIEVRELQIESARAALRHAQAHLADMKAGADALDVKIQQNQVDSAQAALQQAQAQLAHMKAGPVAVDIKIKEHQVASAQAALQQAQAKLADMKAGLDPLDIALSEVQVTNAEISLAGARENLEKAAITAPFDGLVASVNNKVRDMVMAGAVVIQLIAPSEFEVEAVVDELDVYEVKLGQAVHVSLDAIPQATLEGRVKAISPMAQRETGVISYEVTISLQPPEDITLKDGLSASSEIVVTTRHNVLLVPSRAVSRSGEESVVQVLVNGEPQERIVSTGESSEGQTEILGGLSEGDKVLVEKSGD